MAELVQAIEQRQMTPQVPNLTLQIPTLHGLWLGRGTPGEPWQVDNVLLQAMGQWTADGPQATLQTCTSKSVALACRAPRCSSPRSGLHLV